MWFRDESQPTWYGDIEFRSGLEAKVAEQLDALGVTWRYEIKPHKAIELVANSYEPDPPEVTGYLPDFAILDAPEDLDLPLWVEVKPAGLLYAVRDHFDVPERFTDDVAKTVTAAQLEEANLSEIWKPKELAEIYGRDVLVVSEINRHRTLSIRMTPGNVVLSRRHPAVNHRQVVTAAEKAEQEARWRAQWAAAAAEREREHAEQLAAVVGYFRQNGRDAQYPGWCLMCRTNQPASEILIAQDAGGKWQKLCRSHLVGG